MKRASHSLPFGTRLENYVIEEALGDGGFSIVYLATELPSWRRVIVKEYMPAKLAQRVDGHGVEAVDQESADMFNHGRRLFFQEAQALADLKHSNIVNVINFFRANGTIYMVMEYEEGQNLQTYIKKYRGNLSEKFLYTVFPPLLSGLRLIHNSGLLHLDIKPGNIHLCLGGKPLLLDFGAVHKFQTTRRHQPSQVVTPGFSPVEQYDSGGYVGPWTDIYAIGATMRACIEGSAPPQATERREKDTMKPARTAFKRKYSARLLDALDWAMEVDPLLRPQSVAELLNALSQNEDGTAYSAGTR